MGGHTAEVSPKFSGANERLRWPHEEKEEEGERERLARQDSHALQHHRAHLVVKIDELA
jgi:hypothetical protein